MQLFHLLKQASNNGPNENDAQAAQPNQKAAVKRDSHAGMKEEEYIQNHDTKELEGLQHMRIDEVEDEHENTRNEDEDRDYESDDVHQNQKYHHNRNRKNQRNRSNDSAHDSPVQHHRGSNKG